MRWKFWRRDDDDEFEDDDGPVAESRPPPEFPTFAVVVSESATNGWHMAAVIRESANIDFYVRAVLVGWPFVAARPARSNRQNIIIQKSAVLSPAGSSPAGKLVVNWAWEPIDGETSQLRFYVKRAHWLGFRRTRRLKLRLTVKEERPPRRRVVVRAKSNPVDWKRPDPVEKAEKKRKFNVEAD